MELVGLARDGEDAVAKARTAARRYLDGHYAKLDGIFQLLQIAVPGENLSGNVLVSSLNERYQQQLLERFELGAFWISWVNRMEPSHRIWRGRGWIN